MKWGDEIKSSNKGPWIVVLILFILIVFEIMPQIRWIFGWIIMIAIILIICAQFIPRKYTDPKQNNKKKGSQ